MGVWMGMCSCKGGFILGTLFTEHVFYMCTELYGTRFCDTKFCSILYQINIYAWYIL
jgi:hypothetical protein